MNAPESLARTIAVPADMLKALPTIAKTNARHTHMPILGTILLEGVAGEMRATSTDLEVWSSFACTYEGPAFAVAISGKELAFAAKGAKSATLVVNGLQATLGSPGRPRTVFPLLPAEEFPARPVVGPFAARYATDGRAVVESYLRAAGAASSEEARGAVLMGTYVEFGAQPLTVGEKQKRVLFTATDGYQLRQVREGYGEGAGGWIAPSGFARALRSLGKLPKGVNAELTAHGGKGTLQAAEWIRFESEGFTVTARCVDGQYPNYAQIIPSIGAGEYACTVDAPALCAAVKSAVRVTDGLAAMVNLDFANSRGIVTAKSNEKGEFKQGIALESFSHTNLVTAFNGNYLAEILALFDSEITFEQAGHLKPAVFYAPLRDTLAILMPLRR